MRILFIIRQLNYGGAQRQLITLANGLVKRKHAVAVATYYPHGEMETLLDTQIHLFDLGKRTRWDLLTPFRLLIQEITDFKPEVVHGYLSTSNFLAVLVKLFKPRVLAVLGKRNSSSKNENHDFFEKFILLFEPFWVRLADLVISNSQSAVKNMLNKNYPPAKIKVVNNGIDGGEFYIDKKAGNIQRQEWGISSREEVVGLVGRFHPEKGHITFIKAAYLLHQRNRMARFVCVGTGDLEYELQLKKLCYDLGMNEHIFWIGSLVNMRAVYGALDILVSASLTESFSNVILEAMACGVPCVVTDVGDSARVVGRVGLVVPPNDPEALAEGVENMLGQLKQIRSSKIRSNVIEKFSVENLISQTEDILLEIIPK